MTELFVIKHERSGFSYGAILQTILKGTAELASTSGRSEPESSSRLPKRGEEHRHPSPKHRLQSSTPLSASRKSDKSSVWAENAGVFTQWNEVWWSHSWPTAGTLLWHVFHKTCLIGLEGKTGFVDTEQKQPMTVDCSGCRRASTLQHPSPVAKLNCFLSETKEVSPENFQL